MGIAAELLEPRSGDLFSLGASLLVVWLVGLLAGWLVSVGAGRANDV